MQENEDNKEIKVIKKGCCVGCGFQVDISRKPIILNNNIINFLEVEENTCESCGHQKDGSTIPVVYNLIQELLTKARTERELLIKFIYHYEFLSNEDRLKVCLELPRFMRLGYKSTGNQQDGDIEEPYSWSVVYLEVINNTKLSKCMLREIEWDSL